MADKKNILNNHEEVTNGASDYFNLSADKRIPEEVVARGDNYEIKPNPYKVTTADIAGLAAYANSIVEPRILEANRVAALHDALLIAVRDKDSGRFDGRVSSKTQDVILAMMDGMLSKSAAPKKTNQGTNTFPFDKAEAKKASEESDMGEKKEKSEKAKPSQVIYKPTQSPTRTKQRKDLKDSMKGSGLSMSEQNKRLQDLDKKASIEALDTIASTLQASGKDDLIRLATEIDVVSNTIELEAAKSDKKEKKDDKKPFPFWLKFKKKATESLDSVADALQATGTPELLKLAEELDIVSNTIEGVSDAE